MKFDPRKPHGTITNHPWARYEQDGVLFDSLGKPRGEEIEEEAVEVEEVEDVVEPVNKQEKLFAVRNARDFLNNILAEGPLPRSSVYRESEANNQDWDNVKTAFAQMGGEKVQRKNAVYWKLKTE